MFFPSSFFFERSFIQKGDSHQGSVARGVRMPKVSVDNSPGCLYISFLTTPGGAALL